jgi:hypothetical protein
MTGQEKEAVASLERQGIILFELRGDLQWVTLSCVRLSQGFLPHLLSDVESTIDQLKSRIDDIESR